MPRLTTERLALFGTLLATFGELHPLMELDAALHRSIGIAAAAVTTWLTTRPGARR
ncbi:hypothetical protein BN159_p48 (plasmid) [Streptomyces davaonensis JCM 4913]|uniref:Uncharacterized protein n=1 Tax=Streptomyces davaonensis (strain DSM 101723 / JCM 4913 / KCC S-0913 / 768) TaxID=1214101 RepID=K4R9H8_STRDJ|nr:hypothetical protein [Streptomyces davaonensis]CCK32926.1 hypothetical protein BN159_p48 [Streptomyces davaonensis JCM 4913]